MAVSAIDTETMGSAGTLVGAGLLTAGHYLQSQLLDLLEIGTKSSLSGSLGVLIFVMAAVSAIITISIGGRYRLGLWFFIGPALFYQMTLVRTESRGVYWEFGDRTRNYEVVKDSTKGLYGPPAQEWPLPPAGTAAPQVFRVSWFFATWDSLVTSVVNSGVTALNVTKLKSDLNFIAKTDRFLSLQRIRIGDPDLQLFVHAFVIDKCAEYYSVQRNRYDPERIIDKTDLDARIVELGKQIVIKENDFGAVLIKKLRDGHYFGADPPTLQPGYTCGDLWRLALQSLKTLAMSEIVETAQEGLPTGTTPGNGLTVDESLAKMAKKFCPAGNCDDQGVVNMVNAVAVRMFNFALRERHPGLAERGLSRSAIHPDADPMVDERNKFDTTRDLKILAAVEEYMGKGEYFTYMMSLPYLQAMGQFFLVISYPLFALFLIMPGKHPMFFHWMGLWVWLKLWDFGFAVVMLFDEVLYFLMPRGPAMTENIMKEPGLAIKAVLEADPTYTVSLYYTLMATLMGAVPVITGMALKKGGSAFINKLSTGGREFATRVGGSFEGYMASFKAMEIQADAEKDKGGIGRRAIIQALSDPIVQNAIGRDFASSVAQAAASGMSAPALMEKAMKGLSGANAYYARNVFGTAVKYYSAEMQFQTSTNETNVRRAHDMVLLGYFNHDLNTSAPIAESVDAYVAQSDIRISNPIIPIAGGLVDKGRQFVQEMLGSGKGKKGRAPAPPPSGGESAPPAKK